MFFNVKTNCFSFVDPASTSINGQKFLLHEVLNLLSFIQKERSDASDRKWDALTLLGLDFAERTAVNRYGISCLSAYTLCSAQVADAATAPAPFTEDDHTVASAFDSASQLTELIQTRAAALEIVMR